MVDIGKIKDEIVERLLPLKPDKIILFGSYAYGNPDENSDIDLFLLKNNLTKENIRKYELEASISLHSLVKKHNIGFDVLSDREDELYKREDYFSKNDILKKGIVLYGK